MAAPDPDPFDAFASRPWRPGGPFDTSRTRALLARLGDPHERVDVVHVAGTNGKGSVTAILDAAFRASGHRTGRFTSPPLVRTADQVRVDGREAPAAAARAFLDEVLPWADAQDAPPTGFELLTAFAFHWWAREGVDVAVVEAGLGGARDATNVAARTLASVITNVSGDHLGIIGPTVADAAREKAGVTREGRALVTGAHGDALDALRAEAKARGATPIRVLGEDLEALPLEGDLTGQAFAATGLARDYPEEMRVALPGVHQAGNAVLALAALDAVADAGLETDVGKVVDALAHVRWPGRLHHVPGEPALLLDAAHNPAGVKALTAFLADQGIRPVLLFGCLADKEWMPMVTALAEHVKAAVVTRPPNPRALDPMESAREFSRQGVVATVVEDPAFAANTAIGQAGEGDVVLVTGSSYLVGYVLDAIGEEP